MPKGKGGNYHMDIFGGLTDWVKDILGTWLSAMFDKITEILSMIIGDSAGQLKSPVGFSQETWDLVKSINEDIMLPVAGLIMTYVVSYELITMILEKNNMAEMDVWQLYKWFFKTFITIELVTNAFTIIGAIMNVGGVITTKIRWITSHISSDLENTTLYFDDDLLEELETGDLIFMCIEFLVIIILLYACYVSIQVIMIKRLFNIYVQSSFASIPFATWGNSQLNNIGMNYVKNMLGLAFQSAMMVISLDVYAIKMQETLNDLVSADGGNYIRSTTTVMPIVIYSLVLIGALKASDAMAKSLFDAH